MVPAEQLMPTGLGFGPTKRAAYSLAFQDAGRMSQAIQTAASFCFVKALEISAPKDNEDLDILSASFSVMISASVAPGKPGDL